MHGRMRSTPARRRRQAPPAESLRGQGPRVRRRASGRARLSRLAWPRDIACPARVYHADANALRLPSPADVTPFAAVGSYSMRLGTRAHNIIYMR